MEYAFSNKVRLRTISADWENLLNSEGKILSLYHDPTTKNLIIAANTGNTGTRILTRTSKSILKLYLQGRINLQTVFEIQADKSFIVKKRNGIVVTKFLEISTTSIPKELDQICCKKDIFPLINQDMKVSKDHTELLELIPDVANNIGLINIGNYRIKPAGFSIFSENSQELQIVGFENDIINQGEYDFILLKINSHTKLLIRIVPAVIKLLISGALYFKDVVEVMDAYILDENEVSILPYRSEFHSEIVKSLPYLKYSYFQLPEYVRIEHPHNAYRYYQDYHSMNGLGKRMIDDSKEKSIDLKIN